MEAVDKLNERMIECDITIEDLRLFVHNEVSNETSIDMEELLWERVHDAVEIPFFFSLIVLVLPEKIQCGVTI